MASRSLKNDSRIRYQNDKLLLNMYNHGHFKVNISMDIPMVSLLSQLYDFVRVCRNSSENKCWSFFRPHQVIDFINIVKSTNIK